MVNNYLGNIIDLIDFSQSDFFLISNSDQFLNEYLPESEKRIQFLTGFTGSNAFVILGKKESYFFTDSRYLIQAQHQIDNNYFKIIDLAKKDLALFLSSISKDKKILFDPKLFSTQFILNLKSTNCNLVSIYDFFTENPIDLIWKNKKLIKTKIFSHDIQYSGEDWQNKVSKIRSQINGKSIFITSAELVSYIFNLRSFVINYVPTCLSFAIISQKNIIIFLDKSNLDEKIISNLDNIKLTNFSNFEKKIRDFCNKNKIYDINIDLKYCNYFIYSLLIKNNIKINNIIDPTLKNRSIKNLIEIEGMKKAQKKDQIALNKFLNWLNSYSNKNELDEILVSEKLLEFRKEDPDFICPSFKTISGFAENSAIIHYDVTVKTNKKFNKNSLYLVDSGAQYYCGTTDITRVIAIGNPTNEQKRNFTLVLKGHIALANAKFPKGSSGASLDILARQFLWKDGKNYGHSTGHGVGSFLNVHEGPCAISSNNYHALKAGMILSNEPGIYFEGEYGIRIENLILIKESNDEGFLEFETITYVPIDENLINFEMLEEGEKKWIKKYNNKSYLKL